MKRILFVLQLAIAGCAYGVENPPSDEKKPAPAASRSVASVPEPRAVCRPYTSERIKGCTLYKLRCSDGHEDMYLQCYDIPFDFTPEEIPEPYN